MRDKPRKVCKNNGARLPAPLLSHIDVEELAELDDADELLAVASLSIMECHHEQPETETARAEIAARDKMSEERLRMIELLRVGWERWLQGGPNSRALTSVSPATMRARP